MSSPYNQSHPEDLLDAYALDALEETETLQVESHLEVCDQCRQAVAELHNAVGRLSQSVIQQQPRSDLRLRLMQALEPVGVQPETAVSRPFWRPSNTPLLKFLLPTAAAAMIALFALGVVMNSRLSNRTEDLEQENATLTAQVALSTEQESQLAESVETLSAQAALSTEQDSQLAETVQQLRVANYWLANPENQSMNLEPPSGSGSSRGILVVTNDGSRAMLLLAGMEERPVSAIYHVWLMRGGDKVWAAKLQVDEEGWGTVTIQPSESVFRFEKVDVTAKRVSQTESSLDEMVLSGEIAIPEPSRMIVLQQPPRQ